MMKSSRLRVASSCAAERLDARRVPQVEAEDLQPIAPTRAKSGSRGVARRRIARKARRDDEVRAGAQQLEPGLVADLHAPAGEQRDAAAQVGQLGALREVQLGARRAQLIVEVVDDRVVLLADVAVLRRQGLPRLGVPRREDVRRREHRLPAKCPDAGLGQHALVPTRGRRFPLADDGLHHPASRAGVGVEDRGGRLAQPPPVSLGQQRQQAVIGGEGPSVSMAARRRAIVARWAGFSEGVTRTSACIRLTRPWPGRATGRADA